jgi:4-carboxymuconolactone decarboxylase
VGRQNGISQEKLENLHDYARSSFFSETEKLVLAYADAMTRTPVEVPDEMFSSLRAKFDEAQLVELTANIAWENYRARFNHAFGLEAEGFSEGAFCAMPVRAGQ